MRENSPGGDLDAATLQPGSPAPRGRSRQRPAGGAVEPGSCSESGVLPSGKGGSALGPWLAARVPPPSFVHPQRPHGVRNSSGGIGMGALGR